MDSKINIEGLLEQLDCFLWGKGKTSYTITESFPRHGARSYTAVNLQGEICSEMVIFNDEDSLLCERKDTCYVLPIFGIGQAEITADVEDGVWSAKLVFGDDGWIEIVAE